MAVTRHRQFETLLEALCLDGKDILVTNLQAVGSLKAARLSCKAFRKTVDGSLRRLDVHVTSDEGELVVAGCPFPLRRWPRLSQLHIAGWPVDLPCLGNPAASLAQITDLSIRTQAVVQNNEIASILYRVPSVRKLALGRLVVNGRLQLLCLHDALASLSHLEDLSLSDPVQCTAGPACRLRRLEISFSEHETTTAYGDRLTWLTANIHRFQVLEGLTLSLPRTPDVLRRFLPQLMRSLPASVRTVTLYLHDGIDTGSTWEIVRQGGAVTELHLSDCSRYPWNLTAVVEWAERLLVVPTRHRLRVLALDGFCLYPISASGDPRLGRLFELARSCQVVHVGRLKLAASGNVGAVLALQEALGTPAQLVLMPDEFADFVLRRHCPTLSRKPLAAAPPGQQQQQQQQPPGQQQQQQQQPWRARKPDWASVNGEQMLALVGERVVRKLAAAAAGTRERQVMEESRAEPQGAFYRSTHPRYVVLQGPGVAGLIWAPSVLHTWLVHLQKSLANAHAAAAPATGMHAAFALMHPAAARLAAQQAARPAEVEAAEAAAEAEAVSTAAVVAETGAVAQLPERRRCSALDPFTPGITACLRVPSAGALVLQCPSVRSAAALAAAARAAVPEGALGGGGDVHLVLDVPPNAGIMTLLAKAAQDFWDSGEGGGERERLRLLMLIAEALDTLRDTVQHQVGIAYF